MDCARWPAQMLVCRDQRLLTLPAELPEAGSSVGRSWRWPAAAKSPCAATPSGLAQSLNPP